jgi:hypothetical protein
MWADSYALFCVLVLQLRHSLQRSKQRDFIGSHVRTFCDSPQVSLYCFVQCVFLMAKREMLINSTRVIHLLNVVNDNQCVDGAF